jgi:hypothetical protein
VAAGREHDCAGVEQQELTAVHVEADRAVDLGPVREQSRDHHVLAVGDRQRLGAVDESVQHRLAGVVASEGRPPERLRAEEALVDIAVRCAGEVHPPLVEFAQALGHLLGDGLDLAGVVEEVALVEGVRGVDCPRILGVVGPQGAVDPATGPGRVSVAVVALAQHQQVLDAALGEFDGRPRARRAGADHQHRHVDLVVLGRVAAGGFSVTHTHARGYGRKYPSRVCARNRSLRRPHIRRRPHSQSPLQPVPAPPYRSRRPPDL